MAYKDKNKQREATRDAVRRYREKQQDVIPDVIPSKILGRGEGGLHQVVFKCRTCGKMTYHPSSDKKKPIEIIAGTQCLECLREGR